MHPLAPTGLLEHAFTGRLKLQIQEFGTLSWGFSSPSLYFPVQLELLRGTAPSVYNSSGYAYDTHNQKNTLE